ncbi:MAG: hypothetical protein IID34_03500 [Planctomycetes bacterium]|nr:hypothetical protein [Planctomycetota bacterium]
MKETSRTSESDAQSNAEIDAYIERFKDCTPEELLRYMGEARDFFWKYMTPEGKQFFQATRFGEQPERSDG